MPLLILASLRCKCRVRRLPGLGGGQVARFIMLLSCCPLLAWEQGPLEGCCVAMYNSCSNSCVSGRERERERTHTGTQRSVMFSIQNQIKTVLPRHHLFWLPQICLWAPPPHLSYTLNHTHIRTLTSSPDTQTPNLLPVSESVDIMWFGRVFKMAWWVKDCRKHVMDTHKMPSLKTRCPFVARFEILTQVNKRIDLSACHLFVSMGFNKNHK